SHGDDARLAGALRSSPPTARRTPLGAESGRCAVAPGRAGMEPEGVVRRSREIRLAFRDLAEAALHLRSAGWIALAREPEIQLEVPCLGFRELRIKRGERIG